MLVILRNISIKIHFAACFELKHIKVCFHFLNFPLIKFHLRGFHLLQKFSLAHHLQMHTRHIIAIMMVIRRYAKLNKCLWACMNIIFCIFSSNAVWKIARSFEILNKLYFLFAKEKSANLVKKIIISECRQNISTSKLPPPCSFKRVHICVRDQFYFISNLLIIQLAKEYFLFKLGNAAYVQKEP